MQKPAAALPAFGTGWTCTLARLDIPHLCKPLPADRFAEYSASQCGFCTPGFIVATHQALTKCQEKGEKPTEDVLQKGLDGNLCRCTGYRPILDACKVRCILLPACFPCCTQLLLWTTLAVRGACQRSSCIMPVCLDRQPACQCSTQSLTLLSNTLPPPPPPPPPQLCSAMPIHESPFIHPQKLL